MRVDQGRYQQCRSQQEGQTARSDIVTETMQVLGRSVPTLTAREKEVLKLIADGARTKGIAAILGVSVKTVEFHKTKLYSKIGANNTSTAVRWAMRSGYV